MIGNGETNGGVAIVVPEAQGAAGTHVGMLGYELRGLPTPAAPAPIERWWLWWQAHGGSGASTLAQACPMGRDGKAGTASNPYPPWVAVCRTHARGLLAARQIAINYAANLRSSPGSPSQMVGLVTVSDTPDRLPKGLAQLRRHVAGAFPYAWHIGWVEAWRCGEPPAPETTPASVRRVFAKIEQRVAEHVLNGQPERQFR